MDIYDLLVLLVHHAARTGLAEHLVQDAVTLIEKTDPKIAEKRAAAEAEAAKQAQEYQEFLAYQAYKAQHAGAAPADGPPAAAPPTAAAGGLFPGAPPVVTS